MCLHTHTTYTACPHTFTKLDRDAYHLDTYFTASPRKCPSYKINNFQIAGMCAACIAKNKENEKARQDREVEKIIEAEMKGEGKRGWRDF
jgi:hypothetical protein